MARNSAVMDRAPCPEGCGNITAPHCHCISCGRAGLPLGPEGCCDSCVADDVVDELGPGPPWWSERAHGG